MPLCPQEFSFAVEDLKIALKCGQYPEKNHFKLYQRLAKSYEGLNDFFNALAAYENVSKSLEHSQLKTSQMQKLKNETNLSIRMCQKRLTMQSFTSTEESVRKIETKFPDYKSKHPKIENASDCLQILYTESKGRHVIAGVNFTNQLAQNALFQPYSAYHGF